MTSKVIALPFELRSIIINLTLQAAGLEPASMILKTIALPIKLCLLPYQDRLISHCRQQDLNLHRWFWRPSLCPLSYTFTSSYAGGGWESNPYFHSHNMMFCLLNYPLYACNRTWTYKPKGYRFWICCVYHSAIQAICNV